MINASKRYSTLRWNSKINTETLEQKKSNSWTQVGPSKGKGSSFGQLLWKFLDRLKPDPPRQKTILDWNWRSNFYFIMFFLMRITFKHKKNAADNTLSWLDILKYGREDGCLKIKYGATGLKNKFINQTVRYQHRKSKNRFKILGYHNKVITKYLNTIWQV